MSSILSLPVPTGIIAAHSKRCLHPPALVETYCLIMLSVILGHSNLLFEIPKTMLLMLLLRSFFFLPSQIMFSVWICSINHTDPSLCRSKRIACMIVLLRATIHSRVIAYDFTSVWKRMTASSMVSLKLV